VPDTEGKQPLWTQVQDAGLTAGAVPPSARRGATGGKEKHLRVREEFRGFEMKK
jgi:hypothetical protein